MVETVRRWRGKTAAALALEFGVSPRTVQRSIALSRADYLLVAAERRARGLALAEAGLSWPAIAAALGCPSASAARKLVTRARRGK